MLKTFTPHNYFFRLGLIASVLFVSACQADTKSNTNIQQQKNDKNITIVANSTVKFETSLGNFVVSVNNHKAPKTAANFLQYVNDGFYDGTIFHRVIANFMIQTGGFEKGMIQKTTRPAIQNEANNGLKNTAGSIAMARTGAPHSATSQFFINTVDNTFLNFSGENSSGWGYAVFGQVTEGLNVVNAIKAVQTSNQFGHQNVPIKAVVIQKAYIVE